MPRGVAFVGVFSAALGACSVDQQDRRAERFQITWLPVGADGAENYTISSFQRR